MWNAFADWLAINYPGLLIGGVILLGAVIAVWRIAKFYYTRFASAERNVTELSTKVNTLPCAKHDEIFNKILDELTAIRTYIIAKNPKSAAVFSFKASPRKLNDAGIQLFQDISGETFLDKNESLLLSWIDEKTPLTALDVESAANEVLLENLDSEIFTDLKLWVYNAPMRKLNIQGEYEEYAITMADICFILSIPLRDRYLVKHPEIKR